MNRFARSPGRRSISKSRLVGICGGLETLEPRQLLAADPVTPDNPLWVAMPGTATIDGILNEAAWSNAFTITRSQPFRDQSNATLKIMYGTTGLYLAFDVQDTNLWADGRGAGVANRWEIETDDAMAVYFDPNDSRDEFFQSDDRAFGVNTGNPEDLQNNPFGNKLVKWVKGDGTGGSPDVVPGGALATGLTWRTVRHGTVNDDNDVDSGWTTEMFLPWDALGLSTSPSNGKSIGMNFQLFFDNNGGTRDLTDHRTSNGGADRWTTPAFIDDQIEGVHSSFTATQSGTHGPMNYAELMFLDPAANSKPAAITNLTASHTTGYSSTLTFTAPAGVAGIAGSGGVSLYQIRYGTSPITSESTWVSATVFGQSYVPRLAGLSESLRLIDLTPNTTYYVAVRGVDTAGNLGGLSNNLQITTQTTTQDPSGGQRLVPSPMGRTLVHENNQAFVAVGDHLGLSWNYTRNLYTGDVWNPTNSTFINFNTTPSYEGTAGPYFNELQSKGVNTMRVFIELLGATSPPSDQRPRGTYWLESHKPGQSTQYNTDMRAFMLNVLQQADAHNMSVIFSPFDTFAYATTFNSDFPWSAQNGGPLASINDFFQNPATMTLAKARMDTVIGWVQSAEFRPYAHRLMGWEIINEWDSYGWTLNPVGDSEPGRETEFRQRSQWIEQLGAYVKQHDPERLLLNSTVAQDPRGPAARQVYLGRTFDVALPHLYYSADEEPVNNPDADRSIRAAVQHATLTTSWLNYTQSHAPILNAEWGMTRAAWPGGVVRYGVNYTQAEDENLYRTMIWSGFASGQFGTSLRIATEELNFVTGTNRTQGYILTDAMRNSQKALSSFVNASSGVRVDFANFNYSSLATNLSVTSTAGKKLKAWGVSDRLQGILYILQDTNLTTGNVTDGKVTLNGLQPDSIVDIEIWSTASGSTGPLSTVSGVFVSTGQLTFDLPSFAKDVAVKFKARASAGQSQRVVSVDTGNELATFYLDQGNQPVLRLQNSSTGAIRTQDISSIARFTGRVVDMDPFVLGGVTYLTVTDENHHLWLFSGNVGTAAWTVQDLTASINAPGLTSDLTHYIPSWGTIQIAGLDARGHAVNYFFQPGVDTVWHFADLTQAFNGPIMKRGLTGYVAPWDGINFAGLNEAGEVIVYWWSLELLQTGWQTLNMTTIFNGPTFVNQLDAYVTPWGGLNIAGRTQAGELYTYWWAPGLSQWNVSSISQAAGAPLTSNGTEVAVSGDGGINLFSTDGGNALTVLRWKPADPVWRYTDISTSTNGKGVELPLGASAVGTKMIVSGRASGASKSLLVFTFDTTLNLWSGVDTGTAIEV